MCGPARQPLQRDRLACSSRRAPAIIWRPSRSASGRNVFEELGEGFTLLDFGAPEAATASIRRAAEASGVPLKLVRDDSAEAREFYEAALVLVRPDQFVAWDSDGDVTDAEGIIRRVVGEPTLTPSSNKNRPKGRQETQGEGP